MKKKQEPFLSAWMPLLLAIFLVGGMLIGLQLQKPEPLKIIKEDGEMSKSSFGKGKIEELLRYIDAKYVDDVNRKTLVEDAIVRILENLDPHSAYISSDYLSSINEQLEGDFDGIGVEFLIIEDTLVVITPIEGGPASNAGILPGDKIVSVSDTVLAGNSVKTDKIMALLRGKNGTPVNVGVIRGKEKELRHFNIIRGKIPINSVETAYMINDETVYVKISRFSAKTYKEFLSAIENMAEEGADLNLIIDLRNNNGGYLQQATNILNQIIRERNKLLVYTQGRTVSRTDYETTGPVYYDFQEVCILINEGSASASEILAGVIQDYDRGAIVGRRSFGKGLVQEQYSLSDGSALRLTVARYYTPSGRSIQRPYDDLKKYEDNLSTRYESGELYSEAIATETGDTSVFFTTNGRKVYAGNGIMPDVFIPLDSVLVSDEYLSHNGYIPEFAFRFFENHQNDFKDWSFERYLGDFEVDMRLFGGFLDFVQKNNKRSYKLPAKVQRQLKLNLKARIAKHLFQDEGYFRVLNQKDESVQKALDLISKGTITAFKYE